MRKAKKGTPKSLNEFVRAKDIAACRVCQLPMTVREELGQARRREITRAVQLEWLKTEHGVDITNEEMTRHHSARHEAV